MKRTLLATIGTLMMALSLVNADVAHAAVNDVVIKHIKGSSDRPLLLICENWAGSNCAEGTRKGCL